MCQGRSEHLSNTTRINQNYSFTRPHASPPPVSKDIVRVHQYVTNVVRCCDFINYRKLMKFWINLFGCVFTGVALIPTNVFQITSTRVLGIFVKLTKIKWIKGTDYSWITLNTMIKHVSFVDFGSLLENHIVSFPSTITLRIYFFMQNNSEFY